MRDWEKDFSLWMHRTSLTSDGDKFNKRAGRWLVFWPTRNDGGEGFVSQLERSVVKLKFRSPVSTFQLLFLFTACARLLVTTRTRQPLFDLGPKLPTKDKEWHIIVRTSATSMTRIDELASHRDCAHTGKLDLQRRRIDVHVTYLQVCASMTLYARLPTLHAGRSPKSAAVLCRIMYFENRSPGPSSRSTFFFGRLMKLEQWPIKFDQWPIKFGLWPIMCPITFRRLLSSLKLVPFIQSTRDVPRTVSVRNISKVRDIQKYNFLLQYRNVGVAQFLHDTTLFSKSRDHLKRSELNACCVHACCTEAGRRSYCKLLGHTEVRKCG